MNITRKVLVLSLLLLGPLPALLYSCTKCSEDPGHNTCRYISQVSLKAYDNGDSVAHEVQGGVRGRALKLELTVMDSLVYCYAPRKSSFMTAAYATYCKEYETRDAETLNDFSISSDIAFDAAHPAGADLTDLFYSPSSGTLGTGVHTYYLRTPPAAAGTHRISVTCNFSSGKVLSDTLPPITLLP